MVLTLKLKQMVNGLSSLPARYLTFLSVTFNQSPNSKVVLHSPATSVEILYAVQMLPFLLIGPYRAFSLVLAVLLLLPSTAQSTKNCSSILSFRDRLLQSNYLQPSLSSWNDSNCGGWDGVMWGSDEVTELQLNSWHLAGTIPSMSNLTSLKHLDLSNNSFNGSLPDGLGSLLRLQYLNLGWNALSGDIHGILTSSCNRLEVLNLEHNNLNGIISGNFSRCSKLQDFSVSHNNLSGTVPADLFNISSLVHVDVAGNQLDGAIPAGIFGAKNLELLDLSNNKFDNWEPSSICNSSELKKLNVSGNQLVCNGTSSWDFVASLAGCKNLQELDLSNNGLRGPFPASIGNLSAKLDKLILRDNKMIGSISQEIWKLSSLSVLDLGNTSVSGTIPPPTKNLTKLKELYLDHNDLDGGLGDALFYLNHLQVLNISFNHFAGPIPTNTSRSLVWLLLSHNTFYGILPGEVGLLPNLTKLDVSFNNLSGEIPSSLANCKLLEFVILQNNSFGGHIPEFFGKMPMLKFLDLSFNDLEGKLPTGGIFDDSSRFRIDGNSKLCRDNPNNQAPVFAFCGRGPPTGSGDGTPARKSRSRLPNAALAAIIIVVVVFLLLLLFCFFYKSKCFTNKNFGVFLKDKSFLKAPLRVTCSDLQTATEGFSSTNLVGSGGIGSVYRGSLEHLKKEVAVKLLKEDTSGDAKSFLEKCHSISTITHCNLVKMLASCLNVDIEGNRFKALIYEFMPNGNLEMWLHEEEISQAMSFKKWNLNLYQRLSMAIDVASALSHLHCNVKKPIVHCNLKPSNILIAEDMTAHISDYGMNTIFEVDMVIRNSTGYIAPECSTGSPVSPMWDVYSFGVILLEMFTGKRPTDEDFGETLSLHKYVHEGYPSHIDEIVDPLLLSEETGGKLTDRARECILSILNIALVCSEELPEDRMEVKEALEKLEQAKLSFLDAGGNGETPHHNFSREESSNAMLG